MASDNIKLPLFQGNVTEDLEKYQFLSEVVWTLKQVQDDDIKKGQLEMAFWGHEFD